MKFQIYKNEWDAITEIIQKKSTSWRARYHSQNSAKQHQDTTYPSKTDQVPAYKPVFPWEHRAQPPTRVFQNPLEYTPAESDGMGSDDDDDTTASFEAPESDGGLSDAEEGIEGLNLRDYGVNQWDAIPGISKYVSALQRHDSKLKPDYLSFTIQDPFRLRYSRPSQQSKNRGFPSAPGIPPPDQWVCDPPSTKMA